MNYIATITCTSLGDQSFITAELHFWNKLPPHLHDSELTLGVPLVAENALVLLMRAAPSDCCFYSALINVLTYLSTSSIKGP